jgi:hypothetical protein
VSGRKLVLRGSRYTQHSHRLPELSQ